ncbi:MAG: hypothetical protein BGO31_02455 [Bacteroidetes bacterium 43-16]|nr:MAG: hypothetical protein BGO31_02455 [Bacteroidetes bacterium 43-16]
MQNSALVTNKDYYQGLDGIRAFAVISVMLFHFYPQGILTIGWAGVDLFFVLSGFLITNILIKNKDKENYFSSFYMRRVIRIFPIYYLVVIPMLLLNIVLIHIRDWGNIGSYIVYLQNFAALRSEYLFGLAHTWSLAIEEQFYLFFPLIIRVFSIKNSFRITILLIILAIAIRFYSAIAFPGTPYLQSTLIFTRMDSLLLGGLLPLFIKLYNISFKRLNLVFNVLLLLSGLLIVLSIANYNITTLKTDSVSEMFAAYGNPNLNTGYGHLKYTILAVFFMALIGKIAYTTSPLATKFVKFLSNKPLAYIGKISYGIYLYHWVIQEFFTLGLQKVNLEIPAFLLVCIKITLSIVIAALSWNLIEKPILKLKDRYKY